MTALGMKNVPAWVRRAYASMGKFQWAREFLTNSLEAHATRVEFGIEWEGVVKHGIYRRTVADDGVGMTREELHRFFADFGESGKELGGVHDNFGFGAKLSSLPWNPDGLIVISRKDGRDSMIKVLLDRDRDEYVLENWALEDTSQEVIDPNEVEWPEDDVDWSAVMPGWVGDHGTVAVFIGDQVKEHTDTILGDPEQDEDDIKGLSVYLNTRFWEIPDDVQVTVLEPRQNKKTEWPKGPDDKAATTRPNSRKILGAKYYVVTGSKNASGRCGHQGVLPVAENRVKIEWYLWEGDRPAVHSYAKKGGYIAIRYKGELFNVTDHGQTFRAFGITPKPIRDKLTLIIEPLPFNGVIGVHPDDTRQSLRFTSAGDKATDLPLMDWAHEFLHSMPHPLMEAVQAARSTVSGSITNDRYKDLLMQRYGDRWKKKVLVVDEPDDRPVSGAPGDVVPVKPERKPRDKNKTPPRPRPEPSTEPPIPSVTKKRKRPILKRRANGEANGVERTQIGFVPDYEWANTDVGDQEWHLAIWERHRPDGQPTVTLSAKATLVRELIRHFQLEYPPVVHDEVERKVQEVLGEVIVCKVAHACTMTSQGFSEEQIDREILSPGNLTFALMGFLAEEAVISQRLGPLGKKVRS